MLGIVWIVALIAGPRTASALSTFTSSPRCCLPPIRQCTPRRATSIMFMATVTPDLGSSDPRQLVRRGMQAFRQGDVTGSIDIFDRAEELDPSIRPFLWQRGLSYYYAERFQEASQQFRYDVKVNPLDVEEIVWDIASQSRIDPTSTPPPSMLSLPKGKTDRRRIMSTVYALYRGEATEHDLAMAGHEGSPSEEFYALFYLGLYCEACRGENAKAENYMRAATTTSYATSSGYGDYMTSCARVHCQLRGWT